MPRLEPGGPGLAVSPDHAWLAVAHDSKLTLIDTATRETRAQVDLPFPGETDLLLSRERLFAFVRLESSTGCLVYSLPSLEPITSMELIGQAKPLAAVAERILVVGLAGDTPRMLTFAGKNLVVDPIPLREPVQFAAEAPEDRLLVCARDQVECWDPLFRRALFRLHLPVNRPKLGGFSTRRRQLWIVSATALGPLEVYRFSDGRLQARTELGKRVLAVDGHPESPRLVVAAREGQEPIELLQFDLALGERRAVVCEGAITGFAVVDGARPVLVVARPGGAIDYVTLPQSTPLEEPAAKPAPKRESSSEFTTGSGLADRLAGWRNRLATDKPPDAVEAARTRFADPPKKREEQPKPVRPAPVRPQPREEKPVPVPVIAREERTPAPAAPFSGGWRSALCAWTSSAIDSPHAASPPPFDESSTLASAVARLGLTPPAARGLALLYGQWLLGEGAHGVALSTLAQITAEVGQDGQDGWSEALLQGSLGKARLCRISGGRVRLRAFAARFLDGRAPRVQIVQPPAGALAQPLTGSHRVASRAGDLSFEDSGDFSQKLARAVAAIPAGPRKSVEPALAEARLHDAVPLVLGSAESESWAELAGQQILLVAADENAPASLQSLPLLE